MSAIDSVASGCCVWEPVAEFFTETIPQGFQTAWDGVANWVDEYVRPFFESCHNWFSENAEWLWCVAIVFVSVLSITLGVVFSCLMISPQKTQPLPIEEDIPPLEKSGSRFEGSNPIRGKNRKDKEDPTTPPSTPEETLFARKLDRDWLVLKTTLMSNERGVADMQHREEGLRGLGGRVVVKEV